MGEFFNGILTAAGIVLSGLIGIAFLYFLFRTWWDERSGHNRRAVEAFIHEQDRQAEQQRQRAELARRNQILSKMPELVKSAGTSHGSATWESPRDINLLYNGGENYALDSPGYYIGAGLKLKKQMHAITFAAPGEGKGVSLILPNLLCKPHNSWFVLDPKGENAMITARFQKQSGQRVVILDPWNEQKRLGATHGIEPTGFNPLAFAKSNPDEMPESCAVIAEMLVPDNPNTKDEYWPSRARTLIKTYLLHIMTELPEDEQHLGTLYKWLRLDHDERAKLWVDMKFNTAIDGAVQAGINQFYGMNPWDGPLPSIISTAQDNTEFLESAPLRKSLASNEFDPYDLTDGETTLYLCLPERFIKSHARWLRLVVGVCLKACNYRPRKRINFLLDEFAILGKMQDVQQAYAFSRGQLVSVWAFAQSLNQLQEIYGEHGANGFMASSGLRQFFGVYDLPTQKYLSEYLGETTIEQLIKSESRTEGTSKSTSTGWSSGSGSSYGAGGSSTSYNSGRSGGTQDGTSTSRTQSVNRQYMGRRLLTAEEIGRASPIITLLETHKYQLPRLPYWDSIYAAFREGRYLYYPKSENDWIKFYEVATRHDISHPQDLRTIFLPRADERPSHGRI